MDNTQISPYGLAVAVILRRLYEENSDTYDEIAEQTGLAKSTVFRVINGEREATAFYLHKLCEVFKVSPGSVLDEADSAGEM